MLVMVWVGVWLSGRVKEIWVCESVRVRVIEVGVSLC
jgi:hypothetical protein